MRWSRYTPASVTLEDHHGLERVPTSRRWLGGLKPSSRPEDLVNFDARHVFHDVFLSPGGDRLVAIGPPLRNLASELLPLRASAAGWSGPGRIRTGRRTAVTTWRLPPDLAGRDELSVRLELGSVLEREVVARRSRLAPVEVQWVTLQKDNPTVWIVDWIRYHAGLGVERFLIYDNGSADQAALAEALDGLEQPGEVVLVDWPYPYGPRSSRKNSFCQPCQNRHAHLCFGQSRWAGHFDVDEYLVLRRHGSLGELLDGTRWPDALLRFDSHWVPNVGTSIEEVGPTETITVRDFPVREREARGMAHKYIVREDKLRLAETHNARVALGWRRRAVDVRDGVFLHYKALTTQWRANTVRGVQEPVDSARHVEDRTIVQALTARDEEARGLSRGARWRPRSER